MALDYISIGKQIKEFRKARGWKQSELAEKSGIEPSNISHIERAATKLSLPTLISIANALNVTLDQIVYASLINNRHVSISVINDLISDCTNEELDAFVKILKTTKSILRNK